jgi:hypothetical protein
VRPDTRSVVPIAAPLMALLLGSCGTPDGLQSAINAREPYPANYRSEIPAFLRSYLNDPAGLREAAMAEPVLREVGGRNRYVSCLRFVQGGKPQQLAVVYLDGRLDRALAGPAEPCAAAAYAPFPELEKLSR